MLAHKVLAAGFAVSVAIFGAAPAVAQESTPEATLKDAYAITIRQSQVTDAAKPGKPVEPPWRPPNRQRLMTKALGALFARDDLYMSESGDIGHIDSDPFLSGQDGEIKNLKISVGQRSSDRAVAYADFVSFGNKTRVRFVMALEGGRWRIDDIVNRVDGKDYPVREALSQPYDCGSFMKKRCKK